MTSNDPLHGVTLEAMVTDLVERRGFYDLGERIPIRCFTHDPSVSSSLKFLRRTPWARAQVEQLYLADLHKQQKNALRNQKRAERRATKAAHDAHSAEPANEDSNSETAAASSPHAP